MNPPWLIQSARAEAEQISADAAYTRGYMIYRAEIEAPPGASKLAYDSAIATYQRAARILGPGTAQVDGPAIFELPGSTLVVPPGWHARADADGVVLER